MDFCSELFGHRDHTHISCVRVNRPAILAVAATVRLQKFWPLTRNKAAAVGSLTSSCVITIMELCIWHCTALFHCYTFTQLASFQCSVTHARVANGAFSSITAANKVPSAAEVESKRITVSHCTHTQRITSENALFSSPFYW